MDRGIDNNKSPLTEFLNEMIKLQQFEKNLMTLQIDLRFNVDIWLWGRKGGLAQSLTHVRISNHELLRVGV